MVVRLVVVVEGCCCWFSIVVYCCTLLPASRNFPVRFRSAKLGWQTLLLRSVRPFRTSLSGTRFRKNDGVRRHYTNTRTRKHNQVPSSSGGLLLLADRPVPAAAAASNSLDDRSETTGTELACFCLICWFLLASPSSPTLRTSSS